jgi:hypothetical protein
LRSGLKWKTVARDVWLDLVEQWSCFRVEDDPKRLVVDPDEISSELARYKCDRRASAGSRCPDTSQSGQPGGLRRDHAGHPPRAARLSSETLPDSGHTHR